MPSPSIATILIVENRLINREFLATPLTLAGFRVLESTDGAQALEIPR
jgi:CheY-like chemotaxis protein